MQAEYAIRKDFQDYYGKSVLHSVTSFAVVNALGDLNPIINKYFLWEQTTNRLFVIISIFVSLFNLNSYIILYTYPL